jgi:hypothetical protein
MTGFIVTSLQLQSITTAHNQWLSKPRSITYWTTSVFSSTVTDLVLIYESITSSASVVRLLALHSWTLKFWILLRLNHWTLLNGTELSYDGSLANESESESESYVTTDGQSASLSWNKAPIWGLRPDFYYCQTVAGLLMWGALSDERAGLSFTIAAGPRQRSHSRIRFPWDSQTYFTVSNSRLLLLSPRKWVWVWVLCYDRQSVGQSVLV